MTYESRRLDEASYRFRFGSAEFDPQRLELRISGSLIEVQRKPLEILAQLLANAGSIVKREEILQAVWGNRPLVDNVIASAVTKLRIALGRDNAAWIVTHPRIGYRWCGPVQRVPANAPAPEHLELASGTPLPKRTGFVLTTRLASTSCNEVWTAQHINDAELRVYKFSRTAEGLRALKREAALAQVLEKEPDASDGIARVLDWNLDSPPYFVGYEYAGINLAAWSECGDKLTAASQAERIELFLHIARAVSAIHAAGVVHQDLKPSNILLKPQPGGGWQVRLADFGSGRLLQSERIARMRITQFGLLSADALASGTTSATALYIAPELLAGAAATARSDLYALGVLLYQLVVGDLRRPMASGWERQIDSEPLREDIARATDCDVTQRFASVAELCERLTTVDARAAERRRLPEASQVAQKTSEAERWRRARRGWMAVAFASTLLVVLQAALIAYDRLHARTLSGSGAASASAHSDGCAASVRRAPREVR